MLAGPTPLDPPDGEHLPLGAHCQLLGQLYRLRGGRDQVSESVHQTQGQPAKEVTRHKVSQRDGSSFKFKHFNLINE
mgnify:FL=1